MTNRSIYPLLLLALLAPLAWGCAAAQPPRPQPGDRVVPEIQLSDKPWRAGEPVTLVVCLQVKGSDAADARLLQVDEVPKESVPAITFRFWKDEELLETIPDVPLVRDC